MQSTKEDLRILIVEDEFTIALSIEQKLLELGYNVLGIASNYLEALQFLAEESINFCILDINLRDSKDGVELGKVIDKKYQIPFIFLTAYSDESVFSRAQEANPMGYIIKPFDDKTLDFNIRLAHQNFEKRQQQELVNKAIEEDENFFVKDKKGQYVRLNPEEILWLEAMDNYTIIHFDSSRHIIHSTLKDLLAKLGEDFVRVHRSFGVPITKINYIQENFLVVGGKTLNIGKSYRKELMQRLKFL